MFIDADLYIHPSDKAALAALKAVPGFSQATKAFMKVWNEKQQKILNMSTNLKLSGKQLSKYYDMLPPICKKLGIPVPELYITLDVNPNAYTYGDTEPYMLDMRQRKEETAMETKQSNYEMMKDRMAEEFLAYDHERSIENFSLEHNEKFIFITFVGRKYRIDRTTGIVSWSEDAFETEITAGFNEAMTIYDVLCNSKSDCRLSIEWVNISSLSMIKSGSLQSGSDIFKGSRNYFDGKLEGLSFACEALNGKKLEKGDVAYEIQLFPFLPVVLRYWESDEDFPASMQILVDRNILDYMHYETLMFALTHLLSRIRALCGEYELKNRRDLEIENKVQPYNNCLS